MKISADSLFHFTPKFEYLENIIANGFRYSILKEDIPFSGYRGTPFSIPGIIQYINTSKAVCFCDIPLELCKDHLEQYGSYVIGLNKKWGIGKGITPIRYIHYYTPDINNDSYRMMKDSYMMYQQDEFSPLDFYTRVLCNLGKIEKPTDEDFDKLPNFIQEIVLIMSSQLLDMAEYILFSQNYLRAYEGNWVDRVTNTRSSRIFYNEREWRAIDESNSNDHLSFGYNDITHIIVNSESEKKKILSYLIGIYKIPPDRQKQLEDKLVLWDSISML